MTPFNSILVATDLSSINASQVEHRAALLAQEQHRARWQCDTEDLASMTLMHALPSSPLDELRRWFSSEADKSQCLEGLAIELNQRHGVDVRTHMTTGDPVEEVTRHADDLDASLVVTGRRGVGFLSGAMVGSTAERIAKRSPRPVLMVRQRAHKPYQRTLVPVDFSQWSLHAIDLARRIAPQASLVLMHAVEVPFEGRMRLAGVTEDALVRYREAARRTAQRRLQELAADSGLDQGLVTLCTPSGASPWMLIVQEAQKQNCDLVVMGRQGRHAIDEFLLGSTTRMVIAEGLTDVLISSSQSG